jgi:hypothetical protein
MDTIIRVFDASAPVDSEPALLQDQSDAITYLDCSVRPPSAGPAWATTLD